MQNFTMGRTRKKSNVPEIQKQNETVRQPTADAVFLVGAVAVVVMLALPMLSAETEKTVWDDDAAVAVMATVGKEEVYAPSNADTDEWSFYDYIGELFAGLLSGQ